MMKIAFYKGTKEGVAGVYNRGVRWIDQSEYSHCELVFSNGLSASSSFMDKGVRIKQIDYTNKKDWVLVDIPWADEDFAKKYFDDNKDAGYDIMGNIHFIFGFIRGSENRLFCSEAVAASIGLDNSWRFTPSSLYELVSFINNLR